MPGICVIGDVMLDKFSYGSVDRLNPEAPLPLINIDNEEYKLGGAANVSANIANLGQKNTLIGIIGDDNNGKRFNELCEKQNIELRSIINGYPTITKQRFIENTYHQQLLRADYEKKLKLKEKHKKQIVSLILELNPNILLLSDYNKGFLDKELTDMLKENLGKDIKLMADLKPDNKEIVKGFYLLKPNFKEFREMIGKNISNTETDVGKFGKKFVEEFGANLVVTRGEKGATLVEKDGSVHHIRCQAKDTFDVTGAGDTFLAVMAVALDKGHNLRTAVDYGNKASGIVVGKVGTAVVKESEIDL